MNVLVVGAERPANLAEQLLREADNVPAVMVPLPAAAGKPTPVGTPVMLRVCCKCMVILGAKHAQSGVAVPVKDLVGCLFQCVTHGMCPVCQAEWVAEAAKAKTEVAQ